MKTLLITLALLTTPASAAQLAFPGAEGFGRFAAGGRGGSVYRVTTLADSGPGSLRACIDATGARTCVFRVSGYIDNKTALKIENPYITIAGQTAPGDGITITNRGGSIEPTLMVLSHDVIIRNIRLAPAGPEHSVSANGDGLRIGADGEKGEDDVRDVIADHITMRWGTDEATDPSSPMDRVTFQEVMVYEGLKTHSKGPNLRSCGVSIIRSLIASNTIRNPNNTCGFDESTNRRKGGGLTGENEFRNNLVYNGTDGFWDGFTGRGPSAANLVGNVFVKGPSTKGGHSTPYAVDLRDARSKYADYGLKAGSAGYYPAGTEDAQTLCLQDNISIGLPGSARPVSVFGVLDPRDASLVTSTNCYTHPVGNAAWVGGIRGMTGPAMPSAQVQAYVLAHAGPIHRDTVDARIVRQVKLRTGSIPSFPVATSSWPALASGTPYTDADTDGMDDAWETANGVTDPNADRNGDGYTNLEEFLSTLAGDPA